MNAEEEAEEKDYSSTEEEASMEGFKVLSLQRMAARAIGIRFLFGRANAFYNMLAMPLPRLLIGKVLRYVLLSKAEWNDFMRQEFGTLSPKWDPWGSPLKRRVAFYEQRYGKDAFYSVRWDFLGYD